jgi:hypothetical protein
MTRHRDEPSAAPLRYTLPAPCGTVWLGLPLSSLAGLTVTVTAVVLLLLAGAPIWVGALLTTAGAVVSACPVAGRPLLGWLAPGTRHALARVTGADRWTRPWAATTTTTATATGAGAARRWSTPLDLGVGPAQLRLSELGADGTVGAIRHGRHGRVTVVLEVIGAGRFGLLDPIAQDSELARWGSSLATLLADPAVASLQWLTHSRPDTRPADPSPPAPALRTDQDDRHDGRDDDRREDGHHEMVRDYQQLLADVRAQAIGYRHLLAVTFSSGHRSTRRGSPVAVAATRTRICC